jgi:hypothetical protein
MPNFLRSAAGFSSRLTPTSGALPISKSLRFLGAIRHASAQNYNYIRRRECVLAPKPPAGTAPCHHHGKVQNQANQQVEEPASISSSVRVSHLVVFRSLPLHKASAMTLYSKIQPGQNEFRTACFRIRYVEYAVE